MSTIKQDNERTNRDISISVESSNGAHNDNNGADHNNENRNQRNNPSSKYKKFDKKKRKKVILWCQVAVFLVALGTYIASITMPSLRNARPKGIAMWQWSLLVTVLLGGPLVSQGIVVRLILFFLDREFSNKENAIYYVVGLVESAWVVLWFSMIFVAWNWVVNEPEYLGLPQNNDNKKIMHKFSTTFPIINVTLITLILGSFLWLLKDLMLMMAKSSFHIRRFFERIKKSLWHQYVIGILSEKLPSSSSADDHSNDNVVHGIYWTISAKTPQKFKLKRLGRSKTTTEIDVRCLEDVREEEASCWGMKFLIDSMRKSQHLTYKKDKPIPIDDEHKAIVAADAIFFDVCGVHDHDPPDIGKIEIEKHFPKEKVDKVMDYLFIGAHAKTIEREGFRKWMVKAYKYRTALVRALDANKRLFRTLNIFINVLLVIFIFALWLIMLKVETRKVIFVIASAIVGSAFIFGETCKKFMENMLFVFWVHPFDIGDCCLIDNTPVIIEEINVLTTTAVTFGNEKRHYPNIKLAEQSISNYTRSDHMGDFVEFIVDTGIETRKIDTLKEKIKRYIGEQSQYWDPEHYWEVELEDTSKMKLRLHFQHTINYHEFRERQTRKSELVLVIKDSLIEIKKSVDVEH